MELEGRFKDGTQKCEEDEIKGIQKWSRKFQSYIGARLYNVPHRFSAKVVFCYLGRTGIGWAGRLFDTVGLWVSESHIAYRECPPEKTRVIRKPY